MKIRESGMPKEEEWSPFFAPSKILRLLCLGANVVDVVDFGCGYGTFTIPAARIISGRVFAFDIEPEMVEATKQKAKRFKLENVEAVLRDFISEGSGLEDLSVDYVMLFNILHVENPVALLQEAYRILRPSGKVGVIHWNYDAATPRGPPMAIRPKPEQCRSWAESVGFVFEHLVDLKPHHYGLLFKKR